MNAHTPPGLSYRDAGVDIDRGNDLVDRIKPIARRTRRDGVMQGLGGFGALFELPVDRYRQPVLVSGTDGVGTKLRLAIETGRHDTVGIDLVAMCANDLVVQGAEPLFFLDYYATARLELPVAERVIEGIGRGCEMAGMALVGGETAEMPGMYNAGDYDLAGFCVGIVEKDAIIDGHLVAPGDTVIGVASSGPHSNGYSLIRKVLEVSGIDVNAPLDGQPLVDRLMQPTRIYVRPMLKLLQDVPVRALAHITGGGLPENVPRVLPTGMRAVLDTLSWRRPVVFDWLAEHGGVAQGEMYRTFNCGVGMVVVVAAEDADATVQSLNASGESAWEMGHIESAGPGEPQVLMR